MPFSAQILLTSSHIRVKVKVLLVNKVQYDLSSPPCSRRALFSLQQTPLCLCQYLCGPLNLAVNAQFQNLQMALLCHSSQRQRPGLSPSNLCQNIPFKMSPDQQTYLNCTCSFQPHHPLLKCLIYFFSLLYLQQSNTIFIHLLYLLFIFSLHLPECKCHKGRISFFYSHFFFLSFLCSYQVVNKYC